MRWAGLFDDNPENRVAGNPDDLVKHTVYLAWIRCLLGREPWCFGATVHECHAGRGIYVVAPDDPRRGAIEAIRATPLGRAQRAALEAAGAEPTHHYAGSAALVRSVLERSGGDHSYEAYEWDPNTRRILRGVIGSQQVLGEDGDARFDGETYIADNLGSWDERHIVLMDPFAIWDRDKHEERRVRYERIFAGLAHHPSPPAWSLYLTWRNERGRARLPVWTRQPRVEVSWSFGVPCEMWLAPPPRCIEELRSAVAAALGELAQEGIVEHLQRGGDELVRVHIR